jgi:G3E family GTPase
LGAAARRSRRKRGPRFERVLIETTGLADPAPVLHTLMTHAELTSHYRLDGVVTAVDSVNGMHTLDRFTESVKPAAVADRLIMTKADIAEPAVVAVLRERLGRLNPGAAQGVRSAVSIGPSDIFGPGLYNPRTKSLDAQRWLQAEAYTAHDDHGHAHPPHGSAGHSHHGDEHGPHPDPNRHDAFIRSFCLWEDEPIQEETLERWFGALARLAGPDLLRVKGLVNVAGYAGPWVVHGVQHLFHPPVMLPRWPSTERRTRIVFIVRDITEAEVRQALRVLRSFEPS